jgi:hypothetical protein
MNKVIICEMIPVPFSTVPFHNAESQSSRYIKHASWNKIVNFIKKRNYSFNSVTGAGAIGRQVSGSGHSTELTDLQKKALYCIVAISFISHFQTIYPLM